MNNELEEAKAKAQEEYRERIAVVEQYHEMKQRRDETVAMATQLKMELDAERARLATIAARLRDVVCVVEPDAGVVLLSDTGTTHPEIHDGKTVQVYDHRYFSPLGDALMEIYQIATGANGHVLYRKSDGDAPHSVLDGNGDVALGMCRICGRAEAELDEPCNSR